MSTCSPLSLRCGPSLRAIKTDLPENPCAFPPNFTMVSTILGLIVVVQGLFDDAYRFFVRDAKTVDELGLETGFAHARGDDLSAAVNEHGIDADRFQEHDVPEKAVNDLILLHRGTAILDDEGLAAKPLNVREAPR